MVIVDTVIVVILALAALLGSKRSEEALIKKFERDQED